MALDFEENHRPRIRRLPLALSIAEVQLATGLGRTFLYEAIVQGKLPARKAGRRTVILRGDLEAYLDSLPKIR
jgi:excisionase family DNA binding protein